METNFFKLNSPFFECMPIESEENACLPVFFTSNEELWHLGLDQDGEVLLIKTNQGVPRPRLSKSHIEWAAVAEQMETMRKEIQTLKARLNVYEGGNPQAISKFPITGYSEEGP